LDALIGFSSFEICHQISVQDDTTFQRISSTIYRKKYPKGTEN
jgi:hypothetical protein